MSYIEKERLIRADIESIENRVRHAFNQGYDLGYKEGKERAKSQEPTTKNDLGVDCISRQAVEDAMYDATRAMDLNYGQIMEYIDNLPSVTPQPKTGHWIDCDNSDDYSADGYDCSVCGVNAEYATSYCPNCGCRMVEPQESEE